MAVTDALCHRCPISQMPCVTDACIKFQCLCTNLFLFLVGDIWRGVLHNTPFSPDSFACKCLFIAMRCLSGLRPMASTLPSIPNLHWDFSWISFSCLSHGDPGNGSDFSLVHTKSPGVQCRKGRYSCPVAGEEQGQRLITFGHQRGFRL